jgi:uncharacterized protein YbaR (Trm112 family)
MARFTSKTNGLERISSYGQVISCPVCNNPFMLKDTKDGDQAYWCHTCERGWRAGHLPPEARRIKAKALLDASLEPLVTAVLEPEQPVHEPLLTPKIRVQKPRLKSSNKPKPESQPPMVLGGQQSLFEASR